jgi:hypothetical protein
VDVSKIATFIDFDYSHWAQTHPDFAGKFNRSRVVIDLRNRTNRPATPPTDEELET